jgi:hypothetical protein
VTTPKDHQSSENGSVLKSDATVQHHSGRPQDFAGKTFAEGKSRQDARLTNTNLGRLIHVIR